MTDTITQTQTVTITAGDLRKSAQYIVDEVALVYPAYGHVAQFSKPKLSRDVGLMLINEMAEEIRVEIYEPDTMIVRGRYVYRPKADPSAKHCEPGSFRRLSLPKGLSIRIVAKVNPEKPTEEVIEFFKEIGWGEAEPLRESGRGVTERDGGFRSGGFAVQRWVYYDAGDNDEKGGVLR